MRSRILHCDVDVAGLAIHVVQAGESRSPHAVMLVHGWPESWKAFEPMMQLVDDGLNIVAIDLPGVGESRSPAASSTKRALAQIVLNLIGRLGLRDVTLVGHDIGGMIVYACLHATPKSIARAVIMNVAVPGVEPWSEVRRNPFIWHFGFHAVHDLPETLVTGNERAYFDYFFDAIAASPEAIGAQARDAHAAAYSRYDALKTGFDWYRAFADDERDNQSVRGREIATPVLYLRGDKEPGGMLEAYVDGLRASGLQDVKGQQIRDSGHFAPEEQPAQVLAAIETFIRESVR